MEDAFIETFVAYLEARSAGGDFDQLIVAASPRALGAFRKAASPSLAKKVLREVHGDHVNGPVGNLRAALAVD